MDGQVKLLLVGPWEGLLHCFAPLFSWCVAAVLVSDLVTGPCEVTMVGPIRSGDIDGL